MKLISAATAILVLLTAGFLAALLGIVFLLVGAGPAGSVHARPSSEATTEIPPALLTLFTAEASQCHGLPWTVMAGISKVESNHGRYGGSTIASDGTVVPPIIGIPPCW